MVVIPKLGNRDPRKPSSYRQISLNSVLGKLVVKIAAGRIAKHARQCGATKPSQFGLQGHGSDIDALTSTISSLSQSLSPPVTTYAYLTRPSLASYDVQGAFDHTDPRTLI
jgi:hypothetical protein